MNFSNKVWQLTKKIPKGKITTYKIVAKKLNSNAYRAVGQALKKNPNAPEVPCHRVVASDGSIYGYKGIKNNKEKINLLKKEGIKIKGKKIINFKEHLYKF